MGQISAVNERRVIPLMCLYVYLSGLSFLPTLLSFFFNLAEQPYFVRVVRDGSNKPRTEVTSLGEARVTTCLNFHWKWSVWMVIVGAHRNVWRSSEFSSFDFGSDSALNSREETEQTEKWYNVWYYQKFGFQEQIHRSVFPVQDGILRLQGCVEVGRAVNSSCVFTIFTAGAQLLAFVKLMPLESYGLPQFYGLPQLPSKRFIYSED